MRISNLFLDVSVPASLYFGFMNIKMKKDIENAPNAIKIVQRISYNAGCLEAIAAAQHLEANERVDDLYQDWCVQNALYFSKQTVIKVK